MNARKSVELELRRLIATGGFAPGDRLPSERALAERLGRSRNIVREAIRALIEVGALESRDRSGLYLAAIPLEDLFAVRLLLEPAAAALAATNHDAADARHFKSLVRRMVDAGDDIASLSELDTALHLAIAAGCKNVVLNQLLTAISGMASFSRAITVSRFTRSHDVAGDMAKVVRHITARDPEAAEEAMRRHIEHARSSQPGDLDEAPASG